VTDFLKKLRDANRGRQSAWTGNQPLEPLFHAVELGGEVGELLNAIKKVERFKRGWVGSSPDMQNLFDEVGDVLICLDTICAIYGVNLEVVTTNKFNKTSDKYGFQQKIEL
jgi:NTP pyrophosphatase (non-canonical NTP hydrolase)